MIKQGAADLRQWVRRPALLFLDFDCYSSQFNKLSHLYRRLENASLRNIAKYDHVPMISGQDFLRFQLGP